jgi:V/A-type H+-transporting ATPase subunit E
MTQATNDKSPYANSVSNGVEDLIVRLKEKGVNAGHREAQTIIDEAKKQAASILASAEKEAQTKLHDAKYKAEATLKGGEEALKTALRDMVLTLKTGLTEGFKADVERLVEHELSQIDLLKTLIIELAGKLRVAADVNENSQLSFILPKQAKGLKELQDKPELSNESPLTELVFGLTKNMLIDGVEFKDSNDIASGMFVRLEDKDVVLDFSEDAVTKMLLEHLQPRFRAILEGVVK